MSASRQSHIAQDRLGDVVDPSLAHEPQTLARPEYEVAVIAAAGEDLQLKQPEGSLLKCLLVPAAYAVDLDVSRDRDAGRKTYS